MANASPSLQHAIADGLLAVLGWDLEEPTMGACEKVVVGKGRKLLTALPLVFELLD